MPEDNEALIDELRDKMSLIRQKMITLEWDKKHNQMHSGMERKYEELKKEYSSFKEQFDKLSMINPLG